MLRPACVNIPYLSLQLLLKQNPEWRAYPAAVVSEDKPNGIVTELNREAARTGIRPGMRYATALSLSAELRAAVIAEEDRNRGIEEIEELLRGATPEIEPCSFDRESFWLNAAGLTTIYGTLSHWTEHLAALLRHQELYSRIAVGFTRFGSYVAAKTLGGVDARPIVFQDFEEEKRSCADVPVSVLPIPHDARTVLDELGIQRVQELFELPRAGLKERFGGVFERFYNFLEKGARLPIQPKMADEELRVERNLPAPIIRHDALSNELEELTASLSSLVRSRGERIQELQALLYTEEKREIQERLRPAEATTDSALLHRLLCCRLETIDIPDGVVRVALTAEPVGASREQFVLFRQHGSRDLSAASRAFARLRAQFGNDAIQRAVILNEHVPERQFNWHTLFDPTAPYLHLQENQETSQSAAASMRVHSPLSRTVHTGRKDRRVLFPLIRRIYRQPHSLTAAEANTMLANSRTPKNSQQVIGPFYYSTLWWDAHPLERCYYFVYTTGGQIRWLFYDDFTGQWMLTGIVD